MMGEPWFYVWILFIILLSLVGWLIKRDKERDRRAKDYRELLEPELTKLGFRFLASIPPPRDDAGPFHGVPAEATSICRSIVGDGNYLLHRIVRYRDGEGNEHERWARTEFEGWRIRAIRWRPEFGEPQ